MEVVTLKAARYYAKRGLAVFPLEAGEKAPVGKLVPHGVLDATTDEATMGRWFATDEHNIGVAMQPGLVVVDVDPRNGGTETLAAWVTAQGDEWLDGPHAATGGGGLHYWFRYDGRDLVKSIGGVDLVRGNKYVVAPPSVTAAPYRWIVPLPLDLADLPALPAWLLELTTPAPFTPTERQATSDGTRPGDRWAAETTWSELLTADGWALEGRVGAEERWTRPGKSPRDGMSATTGHSAADTLHVFTSSMPGLEADTNYSKFGYLAAMRFDGNQGLAARSLIDRGYGDPVAEYADVAGLVAPVIEHQFVGQPDDPTDRLRLVSLEGLVMRPTHWLWDMYLPAGQISLLAGREGIGKSTVALERAALITRGELPGQGFGRPRDVVIVATEDSFEHTIGPRLVAHGATLDRIYRVEMTAEYAALAFPGDLPALEAACQGHDVALIILDPLLSRLSARLDSHVDGQVRQALEPLGALADRLGANVWGLIHVNKSGSTHPLDAIMASRAFTAFARSVLFCIEDPEQDARFALGIVKSNLGSKAQPTLTYAIEGLKVAETAEGAVWTSRIVWGTPTDRSIEEMLSTQAGTQSKEELAAIWLRAFLDEKGQYPASAIKVAALKEDPPHAWRTVERARKRAGVLSEPVGMPAVFYWRTKYFLPEVTGTPSRAGNPPLASLGVPGTLASLGPPSPANLELGNDLAHQADAIFEDWD